MLIKKPSHRIFDYQPRYYKPENDNKEKIRKRLRFTQRIKTKRRNLNLIYYIVLLIIVIFVYFKLRGEV